MRRRSATMCGAVVCLLIALASAPRALADVKLVATAIDDPVLGGPAVHLLVPEGWVVQGGVVWRHDGSIAVDVDLRVGHADGSRQIHVLPKREFIWRFADDPANPRPLAGIALEQKPPFGDAVVFVERELVPALYPETTTVELLGREPLPQVARVVASGATAGAGHPDVSAARVRLRASAAPDTWDEDIYCVLVQTRAPAAGEELVRWGTERVYVLRAKPGELDKASALLETIASSYRVDPSWAARYRALTTALDSGPGRGRIGKRELEPYLVAAQSAPVDPRDAVARDAEAMRVRVNSVLATHYARTETFFDPRNEREVLLPRGFARAWANARGDYLMSVDPASDPRASDPEAQWAELHAVSAR